MKITYAITVCNESRDLYSLISFLKNVKSDEDDINVLVDTAHVTENVKSVLAHFSNDISTCERAFDGNFSDHRNFHMRHCKGDYIFILDPDEMPQEGLIKALKEMDVTDLDLIVVPRLNITLGATQKWCEEHQFKVNENGWINWPNYQTRVAKNSPDIKFENALHETLTGFKKCAVIPPNPLLALFHVKSAEKDNNRWSDGVYVSPKNDTLYDKLS